MPQVHVIFTPQQADTESERLQTETLVADPLLAPSAKGVQNAENEAGGVPVAASGAS